MIYATVSVLLWKAFLAKDKRGGHHYHLCFTPRFTPYRILGTEDPLEKLVLMIKRSSKL
jgi:hypothetical protein